MLCAAAVGSSLSRWCCARGTAQGPVLAQTKRKENSEVWLLRLPLAPPKQVSVSTVEPRMNSMTLMT